LVQHIDKLDQHAEACDYNQSIQDLLTEQWKTGMEAFGLSCVQDRWQAPDDPASSRQIVVEDVTGKRITIVIPFDKNDQVRIALEGFPLEVDEDSDGNPLRRCDAALAILRPHLQRMANRGWTVGTLSWPDDPDSQPPRGGADARPGTMQHQQEENQELEHGKTDVRYG
jgi:hypothetical protein